jgi:hypothetical protein
MSAIHGQVVPVTYTLGINGTQYPLASCEITYLLNGPASAECSLSVGYKSDGSGDTGAGLLNHDRGVAAEVTMVVAEDVTDPVSGTKLLTAGTYQAFKGVLDEQGPTNLSKGNFNLRARIVSKLAVLQTGSLQLSKLVSSSYLDTTVSFALKGGHQRTIGPGDLAFRPAALQNDFWIELRRVLVGIATSGPGTQSSSSQQSINGGVAAQFSRLFGAGVNHDAADVLSIMSGNLVPGAFNNGDLMKSIADYMTFWFTGDGAMQSFYQRILGLSQDFKFAIIESFNGSIKVVPYSPFFRTGLAVPIYPSTITDMNWDNHEPNSIQGCCITLAGVGATSVGTPEPPMIIGAYARPRANAANRLGTIVALPSPPWFLQKTYVNRTSAAFSNPEFAANIGNGYAKEWGLDLSYRGYVLHVMCPLRTDIGVGMPVQVIYPPIPGSTSPALVEAGPSVYGCVQAVKICMDAVKRQAYTLIEVGYVRSDKLQQAELAHYSHPVWTTQYTGRRLDLN